MMIKFNDARKNLWVLEYSQDADDKGKYPYHITLLRKTLEDNLEAAHEHQRRNDWKIVWVGTPDECDLWFRRLLRDHGREDWLEEES